MHENTRKDSASSVTQAFYAVISSFTIYYSLFYIGTARAKCDKTKPLHCLFCLVEPVFACPHGPFGYTKDGGNFLDSIAHGIKDKENTPAESREEKTSGVVPEEGIQKEE